MDSLVEMIMTLKQVFPPLGQAVKLMLLIAMDTIGRLMGHPGFCSSPAYCI